MKWIGRVMDHRPPEFGEALNDNTFSPIIDCFRYWCMIELAGAANAPGAKLFGEKALAQIYKNAKTQQADKGCSLADVPLLRIWVHLMPTKIADDAAALVAAVEKTVLTVRSSAPKAKAKKAASKDSAIAQAMSLFTT